MEEPTRNALAEQFQRRANNLDISISELCRQADVSRRWFEFFKKRAPIAIIAYMKIERQLAILEKAKDNDTP